MYAPHRTIPHQVKYSTALTEIAEFCRLIPSESELFTGDTSERQSFTRTSTNFIWYFVLEVGIVGRFGKITAYMYVGSVC